MAQSKIAKPDVVDRNIDALLHLRQQSDNERTVHQRLADFVVSFFGSFNSLYLHLVFYGSWILFGFFRSESSSHTFSVVSLFASVEAIFLSSFVLVNQNRMRAIEQRRSDLNLQISLLTEHELTRLIKMVDLVARKLQVDMKSEIGDLEEIKKDVPPEVMLEKIELREQTALENESTK